MNNNLIAKGMMIAFRGLGVEIHDWKTENNVEVIYISVPKETIDTTDPVKLAGKPLADRIMTKLRDMGLPVQIKFRIRDEVWTTEKRISAEQHAKNMSNFY